MVTQISSKETTSCASLPILGSATGVSTRALYLTLPTFHSLNMALTLFVTGMICAAPTSAATAAWPRSR